MRSWTGLLVAVVLGMGIFVLDAPTSVSDHPVIKALGLMEQPVHAQRFTLTREPPPNAQLLRFSVTDILAGIMLAVAAIGLPVLLYLIWAGRKKRT